MIVPLRTAAFISVKIAAKNRVIQGRLVSMAWKSSFRLDFSCSGFTRSSVVANVTQKRAMEITANNIMVNRKPSASSPPPRMVFNGVTKVPMTQAALKAQTNR